VVSSLVFSSLLFSSLLLSSLLFSSLLFSCFFSFSFSFLGVLMHLTRRVCNYGSGFRVLTRRVCSYATHESTLLSSLDTPCPPQEATGSETRDAAVSKAKEDAAVNALHRPYLQLTAPVISSALALSCVPSCCKFHSCCLPFHLAVKLPRLSTSTLNISSLHSLSVLCCAYFEFSGPPRGARAWRWGAAAVPELLLAGPFQL